MSNVPKLQAALSQVRKARTRVAQLAQGGPTTGARIKNAQVRDGYITKPSANSFDQEGDKQAGINNRRGSSRPSGGNPVRGKSNQMVPKVGGKVTNLNVVLQNIEHGHQSHMEKDHPYDREPEAMPVAYGTKAHSLDASVSDRLESVMTQYGPGVKMRGKEFLTVIESVSQTYAGGNSIIAIPINPRLLQLPRLSIMSQLYTRFLFNKFSVHYLKSAGTQNNGSLQIFGVYDPTINPCVRPGETLIAYAAQRGSTDLSLYQDAVLTMDDSHFKDLLFLAPDDDLRWTMQGVVFVIASGAVAAGLEAGKLMLEYEVTLCNDDLDQNSNIQQRSFKNVGLTFASQVTGNRATGTLTGGSLPPSGKYFLAFRTAPTITTPVYQNLDAYNISDATRLFALQKGSGVYAVVVGTTVRFMYGPDLYSEDSAVNTFNKLMIFATTDATANTTTVDMYRFADN